MGLSCRQLWCGIAQRVLNSLVALTWADTALQQLEPRAARTGSEMREAMSDGNGQIPPMNPYGGVGGGGITMPPYYKPTDSVGSGSTYYPTSEELGKDEMRITFVGSCPFPPRRNQAATCIMVELGNGKRFFFDFGPGCPAQHPRDAGAPAAVNDIFLTHLHVDHYGELPYLFAFAPWAARWKPLRVHGPSGRTPGMAPRPWSTG